jgi:DNA-binding CsgD family transcriptional regulator
VLVMLIEAAALCGETELATTVLAQARATVRANEARQEPMMRRAAVWETVAREGPARGRAEALLAADFAATQEFRWIEATSLHDALRLGAGRDVARRLARVAGGMSGRVAEYTAAFGVGLAEGDADAVLEAAVRFSDIGFGLIAAEIAAMAGRLYRRSGDHPAAARAVELSAQLAAQCEGVHSPALVNQDEPGQTLTPREREIVQLAAAGRSNRDIADELVLSVRTVEGHLARAYPKLGVERRDDLAGLFGG